MEQIVKMFNLELIQTNSLWQKKYYFWILKERIQHGIKK